MTYLFRGKTIGSDQWVYGNLLNRVDSIGPLSLIEVQDKETFEIEIFQVKPETVGMWTGLKDKNGSELYQGDIYNSEHFPIHHFVIMFINGAFVGGKNEESCSPIGWVDEDQSNQEWICKVGNITDHPHLLNPAKGAVTNTMNNIDPNEKQATEEVKAAGQEIAAVESEAQENAMESEEEGGSEG